MTEYSLTRSKRKSLSVCIENGKVNVKAPLDMSIEHIEAFLAEKRAWIEKKLASYGEKENNLKSVIALDTVLLHGREYEIRRSSVLRTHFDGEAVYVFSAYDAAATEKTVGRWYRRTALSELSKLIARMSAETRLDYKSFAITNARRAWGNCDGDGNIRLNWRLVMLDNELAEYVTVHELCHTLYHDHSAAFWAEVKKHLPRYAELRKRLKAYSLLTDLYR
ncbi:MAG: M48 family metallopeptidase [Roseburia sp.]|nr:M48 family metallopeptidase [Roseburia sp.]